MKIYNIDITMTHSCNFKCDYCFARSDKTVNFQHTNAEIINFLDKIQKSNFFKSNYDILNIGMWGGEPTMNPILCELLMKYYHAFDDIKFFIYSNGYSIPKMIYDELLFKKDSRIGIHPKICIQISYDGKPIHDIYRRANNGELTSDRIKDQIRQLDEDGIPYVIKSTVTPATFKYMADAYNDIKNLSASLSGNNFQPMNYFPTIDYYTSDHKEKYKEDLKKSLIKIAKRELKTACWGQDKYFFKWFNVNRAICSAGKDMIAIDTDGNIYVCHGCIYGEKEPHHLGMITEEGIVDKLILSRHKFDENLLFEPDECKNCKVSYCLRCNHSKFINSKKTYYFDKWRDYANQPELCEYYKINHKVKIAMQQIGGI